jgi:uncharacterized protein YaeQ
MALKATIFKAEVRIGDVDRNYYQDHALTVVRHPSETDERMMVRVLAFALHVHDAHALGKGVGVDDEPDLVAARSHRRHRGLDRRRPARHVGRASGLRARRPGFYLPAGA